MELQYHPGSGRGAVAAFSVGPAGERVLLFLLALAAGLTLSLWVTAPIVLARAVRGQRYAGASRQLAAATAVDAEMRRRAAALADAGSRWGDRLTRIAFLYGVSPARWPRALDPARGLLASPEARRILETLPAYTRALERGRSLLAEMEAADPSLPARSPSVVPVQGPFEPAAFFGPRVSPWTGEEEFFRGLDLAAPEGTAVVAPGGGTVIFTGRARRRLHARLWQLGNLVVIWHGPSFVTLFGHLSSIEVRRGERVRRAQRIGTVGQSGWALSPRLHYELWRREDGQLRPTDPLFAVTDRMLDPERRSLEQMLGTSAPGPLEPLPGGRGGGGGTDVPGRRVRSRQRG